LVTKYLGMIGPKVVSDGHEVEKGRPGAVEPMACR
jgi:hypothetical protein